MSGPKTIYFLSAADRLNYGDLLFPLIFKSFCDQKNIEFRNYGLVKSNFSDFGGLPTMSYLQLLKDLKKGNGILVVGGGEVFFGNWIKLYSFINPFYAKALKIKKFSKLENKIQIARYLLSHNQIKVPFVISKKEIGNPNIGLAYNSVGGNFSGNPANVRNIHIKKGLEEALWVSVRDQRTLNSLRDYGVNSVLVPDSAILMSQVFSNHLKSYLKVPREKYIFVQIGRFKGPDDVEKMAATIKNLASALKLLVVLCPIGIAPGHEDQVMLGDLHKYLPASILIKPANIWEIMSLLASAEIYLGTSLHGLITAQSFGIKFVPLNKKLFKVRDYAKSWTGKKFEGINFYESDLMLNEIKDWNTEQLQKQTKFQMKCVEENINTILKF